MFVLLYTSVRYFQINQSTVLFEMLPLKMSIGNVIVILSYTQLQKCDYKDQMYNTRKKKLRSKLNKNKTEHHIYLTSYHNRE